MLKAGLQGEYDPRFARTADYVTAQVLGVFFGICSGNKRHFELSESSRSTLISQGAAIGLFDEIKPASSIDPSSANLWESWIHEEKLCRLGWAIYVRQPASLEPWSLAYNKQDVDASVTFLLNKRPFLSISSMRLQLPSSEDLWEADSAQAWASLHPSSPLAPPRKSFVIVLSRIFSGSGHACAHDLGDLQHRHILVLTLARMVWSWKEIQTTPGVQHGRLPLEHFQDTKQDILTTLDGLRATMSRESWRLQLPSSARALLQSSLIIHMSHLYAADDVMDWFYPLIRRGHVAARWKARAAQWAAKNPVKVREVAYHSGQILAISRNHPRNSPTEVFATFHAGLYMWLISSLWQEQQAGTNAPAGEYTLDVRLDQLDIEMDEGSSSNSVTAWILDGSSAANPLVSIHSVPDLAGIDGPRQVLDLVTKLLERMKVWKVSQNLLEIILGLVPD